jgi:hypothetical protein
VTSITSFFGYGPVPLQTVEHNSPYLVVDLIYYLSVFLVCAVYDGGIGKPSEEQGYCQGTCFGTELSIFRSISVFSFSVGSLLFAMCNGELICLVLKTDPLGHDKYVIFSELTYTRTTPGTNFKSQRSLACF